jgi:ATPase subunit of ABC transporter with duplicated ATPase domains
LARIPITLKRLEIEQLRGFAHLDIDFVADSGPYVVIGKNGTCKTTLLRALATVLGVERDANPFLARAITLGWFNKNVRLRPTVILEGSPRRFEMILQDGRALFSPGAFALGTLRLSAPMV